MSRPNKARPCEESWFPAVPERWHLAWIGTFLCFLLLLIPRDLFAQSDRADYIISQYTTESGLPQNSIKGLAFDQLGYCWIGTENGLIKYDGVKFRLFEDYQTPPVSPRVGFIKETDDKILIGFEGGQLYTIQQVEHFGTIPVADTGKYLWGNGRCFAEVKDAPSEGSYHLVNTYVKRASDDYFLARDNQLYINTFDSLIVAADGRRVKGIAWNNFRTRISTVIDGRFTVFINNQSAFTVDKRGHVSEPIRLEGAMFTEMDLDRGNYSLLRTDSITYGFCRGTLYKLEFTGNKIRARTLVTGLGGISVADIYYDEQAQTYYLQSRTDGLILARKSRFENVTIPDADAEQNSFYGQNLYHDNQIIANGHLFSFQDQSRPPFIKKITSVGYLLSSFVDGDNYYYEFNFKLFKLGLKSGQLEMIYDLNDLAHCFQRSPHDGLLYFSTTNKLFALKNDRPEFKLSLPPDRNRYIYSFVFVEKDSVLIATNRGLYAGRPSTGEVKQIIQDTNIRNIYLGKDGYVWLGTYNQGGLVMKSGQYWQLPIDPGKRMAVVNSMVEDNRGRIWFATNNGLLSTNRQALLNHLLNNSPEVVYHIYDKSDGLLTNEFNGSATPDKVFLRDGRVSLPSLKSLVLFNPDTFPVDSSGTKLFINEIVVDGARVSQVENLVLPAGFGSMIVSVSSPWTNKAEALYFERKISGYDKEWTSFHATDNIEVRRLTYGSYTMKVRVKGRPDSQIQFRFKVAPFFYETNWFRLGITLVTLIIIVLFFRSVIRRYKNENMMLDNRIKERTHELNESLENLHETVTQLQQAEAQLQTNVQQKEQIINMLLHDMKSPLFALKNGIEELDYKLSLQPSTNDDILRKSRMLREGISDVYSFSVNFFDWVKYQKEGIAANYQLTGLAGVFGTIRELYGGIAERKGIALDVEPTDIVFYTDENILVTVLRNLVDNAIKNTTSGKVSLSASGNAGKFLTITVQDTGPGMEPELLDVLNEAFYGDGHIESQVGYGYKLIAHLIALIHGDIELENQSGLQVRLYLNLITEADSF
jgi:signal transduction histidine kinase